MKKIYILALLLYANTWKLNNPSKPVDLFFEHLIMQNALKCISRWLEDFTKHSSFSDICKVHGNAEFLGANVFMGIVL